jgi:nucleotide-binding universal stress UspA family protein
MTATTSVRSARPGHPAITARATGPAPPPVVVVHRATGGSALHRAAHLARRSGSPLHVVVGGGRPPTPWSALAGVRRTGEPPVALIDAEALRAQGQHVEVHLVVGRPHRLAIEIARTVGGVVVR